MISANLFRLRDFLPVLCVGICLAGCAPEKTGVVSTAFHNMTAHYNAYFYAKERINEIETGLRESTEDNFNDILQVYPVIDSNYAKTYATQIEDALKKASIGIQHHPNSKWRDDCYLLVGKSRYYGAEFSHAIESFKYVNTNSEDDNLRHEALVYLMRTFTDYFEYQNAIAVADFLRREELSRENEKLYHLAQAHLYQQLEDMDRVVQHLVRAAPLMDKKEGQARIYFTIGQIYQDFGFEAEAFNHYSEALKSHPDFEIEFYSKLYMAQVTELGDESDVRKVEKYFKRLLRDRKNSEYQDKIYYEIGNFKLKQGLLDEAIANYKTSIQKSTTNNIQKGYAYLKLGEIYFDTLKAYAPAQAYYDSAVTVLPQTEENYEAIAERKEILDRFVENINIVTLQDSLLQLAALDTTKLIGLLTTVVEAQMEAERLEREEEEKRARRALAAQNTGPGDTSPFYQQNQASPAAVTGETWYFYNTGAVSIGRSEFVRRFGNRPLEDHWRRSRKQSNLDFSDQEQVVQEDVDVQEETDEPDPEQIKLQRVEELVQTVPFSDEAQADALAQIEEALFALGNIYSLELEEKKDASETFEEFISRFEESDHMPEVLYQLYLIYRAQDHERTPIIRNRLLNDFENSIYARLIDNPNFQEESNALNIQAKKAYEQAFLLYEDDYYDSAQALINTTQAQLPTNNYSDNLDLLHILIQGKVAGKAKYVSLLQKFLEENPDSELNAFAQELLETAQSGGGSPITSAPSANYDNDMEQVHYFVMIYSKDLGVGERLGRTVRNFNLQIYPDGALKTSNIILDNSRSMIAVNEFATQGEAIKYYEKINLYEPLLELFGNQKPITFVMTRDNFNIFYKTKDLDGYVTFFREKYL